MKINASSILMLVLMTLPLQSLASDEKALLNADFTASVFLLTNSKSKNITKVHLINTSSGNQVFSGTLYHQTGDLLGAEKTPLHDSPIPPGARLIFSAEDLELKLGVDSWNGPAMLEITGNEGFSVMSRLENPSGLITNTNCVTENSLINIESSNSADKSYLRFINTTDNEYAAITASLYKKSGEPTGSRDTVLLDGLRPKQQVWITERDLIDKFGSDWSEVGMLEVESIHGLKLINLNYSAEQETFFNFSCSENGSDLERIYLQTSSSSRNVSFTHLLNKSEKNQSFTGTIYGSDGSVLGLENQPLHEGSLSPKSRLIFSSQDIESVFEIPPWEGPAILEIDGSERFSLVTKLTSPSGLISNTNCVTKEQVHNLLGYDEVDFSYIRFINQGDHSLPKITGTVFDEQGNTVGVADSVIIDSLPQKAHLWVSRDQLSSAIGSTWNGTASLKLSSSPADLRLLNLNLVGNQTFFNFSCFESGKSAKNFAPQITNRSREFFLVEGDPFSLFATASDANNDTVTFSLDGEDGNAFALNPSSGRITFRIEPNFENPSDHDLDNRYNFSVVASDGKEATQTSFSVQVSENPSNSKSRNTLDNCTAQSGEDVFGRPILNTYKCRLVSDDLPREFFIYVPEKYTNGSSETSLLLSLHGYTSNALLNLRYSGFQSIADEEGFIVVYPQGTILPSTQETHWNVGGWTVGSETDDVLFFSQLIDHLAQNLSLDLDRVYSTGMSNGGFMSYELACQLSERIAAIASVTGSMTPQTYDDCNPQRAVPVLQIHGLLDLVVPYSGNAIMMPIDDVMQYWSRKNNCSVPSETLTIPSSSGAGIGGRRESFKNCDDNALVELILLYGMGHDWPIANSIYRSHDLDAAETIWDFLSSFTL